MNKKKWVVGIGQAIVFLFALVWIIAGGAGFTRNGYSGLAPVWIIRTMAAGMVIFGVVLAGIGVGLGYRKKIFYYLALGLLAASGILTIFDDFGSIDLLVLLMAAIAVIYFTANKRWFIL